jgi:hypothetical protein
MTPADIIREVQEDAGEWLEMSSNPDAIVSGILAKRIVKLNDYITYLERNLHYVNSSGKARVN